MPRTLSALVAVMAIGLGTAAAIAQIGSSDQKPQSVGTALIMGRVVEATTNAPIPGALVQIGSSRDDEMIVATDATGQFVLGALKAGTFHLEVRKGGYAESAFGQRRPNAFRGTPLTLADGERRGDVTLRLWKYGAITGTVVDEMGDPVIGVLVRAFTPCWLAGRPALTELNSVAVTDDRGVYRLSQLTAGDYVVAIIRRQSSSPASVIDEITRLRDGGDRKALQTFLEPLFEYEVPLWRAGEGDVIRMGSSLMRVEPPAPRAGASGLFIYPSQFFPAAPSVSTARPIAVIPGQDVSGIDFTLRPVRAVAVSGRVIDSSGPVAHFPLNLLPASSTDFVTDRLGPGATTITDSGGRFTFPAVEPGQYVVRGLKGPGGDYGVFAVGGVETSPAGGVVISTMREEFTSNNASKRLPTLYGAASASVTDRAVDDVTIAIRNGVRLIGQVEFSGGGPEPPAKTLESIRVSLDPIDGRSSGLDFEPGGSVKSDRRFETAELPPGRYFVRVWAPDGWLLESIRQGDRDVSDTPIDVASSALAPITVRLTNRPTVISGVVRTAAGDLIGDAALVVAFPVDRTRWIDYGGSPRRLASAGTTRESTFEAAMRDSFLGDWLAPESLAALARNAERVTVTVGETRALALTLGSGR